MDNKIIKIAPSILAADFTCLADQIREVESAGAGQIHIDVMDGRFVPAITFGAPIVEAVRRVTDLPLDVHLMIAEPERHIQAFADAGANAITVHVEASPHLHRTLQTIRECGLKAGVALNPHTPLLMVAEVASLLDNILIMTVNPGAGGQKFLYEMLPKIQAARRLIVREKRPIDITVDGGIESTTIIHALRAGANVLVAGTTIFKTKDGMTILKGGIDRYKKQQAI